MKFIPMLVLLFAFAAPAEASMLPPSCHTPVPTTEGRADGGSSTASKFKELGFDLNDEKTQELIDFVIRHPDLHEQFMSIWRQKVFGN